MLDGRHLLRLLSLGVPYFHCRCGDGGMDVLCFCFGGLYICRMHNDKKICVEYIFVVKYLYIYTFSGRRSVSSLEVKVEDRIIPKLIRFKYIGSIIQNEREIQGDVNNKIQFGWLK